MSMERELWAEGYQFVAGVDEAGRGALAGPVVAAAVVMPESPPVRHVADSKVLTAVQREELAVQISQTALAIGIGVTSAAVIDATNILRATHMAMRHALSQLVPPADIALVDGNSLPHLSIAARAIVDGDSLCYSIAAASIIAKTYRDRVMAHLGLLYPGYGLENHKGYGSAEHRRAIESLGPCPVHRLTFGPLKETGQLSLDM